MATCILIFRNAVAAAKNKKVDGRSADGTVVGVQGVLQAPMCLTQQPSKI